MAQTLPQGVVVPNADGQEPISATGVAEMRTLGASVDSALATLDGKKADTTYVDTQMAAARFTKGNPGPFDFDTFKTPGTYSLGTGFPTGWANVPDGITTAAIFNVYGSPIQSWCAQELIQYGSNPKRLWRISRSTAAWNPWIQVGGGGGGGAGGIASAMASNAAWVTDFIQRTEPVYTGGKAAFSLRLDHGYTNYKSLLRAGLLSRGIRPGIATNSRNWDIEENSGATISEVNGWVAAGDITILNHSATHYGGLDEASLVDEIVNGRLELEAQLPAAAPIWGFAPPGVNQGWDGFGGGNKGGWVSPAAQIILANHAYSCGYVGGTRRVLNGQVNQALGHVTLDTYSMSAARSQVDAAIAEGRGIQMMLHPRELDKAGKISTAEFFSLMDYIVAKRDAGQIVFLTPDEMVRADARNIGAMGADDAISAYRAAIA